MLSSVGHWSKSPDPWVIIFLNEFRRFSLVDLVRNHVRLLLIVAEVPAFESPNEITRDFPVFGSGDLVHT